MRSVARVLSVMMLVACAACSSKKETNPKVDSAGNTKTSPAVLERITGIVLSKPGASPQPPPASFHPGDSIQAVVQLKDAKPTDKVIVNVFFTPTNLQVQHLEGPPPQSGNVTIPFALHSPEGWQIGEYRVDAILNGRTEKSQTFLCRK